jgi:hypothetical protein
MSLDKAIFYGKEKRKPFRGCKAFIPSCRNHCGCAYCLSDRLYSRRKEDMKADDIVKDFENEN